MEFDKNLMPQKVQWTCRMGFYLIMYSFRQYSVFSIDVFILHMKGIIKILIISPVYKKKASKPVKDIKKN
jgi:hypothetical protein